MLVLVPTAVLALLALTGSGPADLSEETDRGIKGEVVLSCNLKNIGFLP